MKPRPRLLPCLLALTFLTGCKATDYQGPSIGLNFGYDGFQIGVQLIQRNPPPLPTPPAMEGSGKQPVSAQK